jgi:tetratricopeptide (TPR) repeat protein
MSEDEGKGAEKSAEKESSEENEAGKSPNNFKNFLESFQFEIDPERIEESVRGIGDKARQLALDSTNTKVRIKFKGKQLLPDMPLGVFVAAEAATFWYGGLIRALAMNLGMKTLVEVEFLHNTNEKVKEGREFFEQGEVDSAEQCYRDALSIRALDPAANYHLGVLLRVTGRRDEAIKCLEIAAAAKEYKLADKAKLALQKMKGGARTL